KPAGTAQIEAIVGPAVEFLAYVALVVFLVVFMLVKREDLRNRVIRLLGHGHVTEATHALDDASQRVSRFLLMQVAVNTGFGLSIGLGLFAIGVPHAFLWGLLAGGLRFLPYVGSPVAAALLLLVSVAVFPNWTQRVLARDPDEALDLVEEEAQSKPPEQLYDELLLPALVLANRDRENEALPPEDARDLFHELRQIIEDVPTQKCTAAEGGEETDG